MTELLGRGCVGEDGDPSGADGREFPWISKLPGFVHIEAVEEGPACGGRVDGGDGIGSGEFRNGGQHQEAWVRGGGGGELFLTQPVSLAAILRPNQSAVEGRYRPKAMGVQSYSSASALMCVSTYALTNR